MKPIDETRFYTPKEIAELFRISTQTVYNLINKGELKAVKFGNTYRISGAVLKEYIERSTMSQDG